MMILKLSILLIGSFYTAFGSQGVTLSISSSFVSECQSFTLTADFFGYGPPTKFIFKNLNTNFEVEVFPPQTSITLEADVDKHNGQWQVSAFGTLGVSLSSPASLLVKSSRTTITVGCDNRQYVYSSCEKIHSEAQQWCTDRGMTLASPGDHIEGTAIKNALRYTVYTREMWVDVTRASVSSPWQHCNSDVGFFSERMRSGSGNCASYHYYYKRFYPKSCADKKPFLCQKAECDLKLPNIVYPAGPSPTKRYVVVTRPRNFEGAKAYCENMNSRLMSIQTIPQMVSVCIPLLSQRLATTAFVLGPRYDVSFGNYTDTCGNAIPDSVYPIVRDDEYEHEPITNKCTVLLNDLSVVHPCDKCQPGFVCEKNLIGPSCP